MPVEKDTRIQTLLLLQKRWNCLPAARTAIKLWIVVATLSQNIERWENTRGYQHKLIQRLDYTNDQLYEVELAKAETEHREPIIVEFFILQYAKLRMLELYYNFFERFCDVNKFEELEMDTDSLYLDLSEKELYDCIREESKAEWNLLRTKDCKDDFTANATTNFFPRTCCTKHMKHDKR